MEIGNEGDVKDSIKDPLEYIATNGLPHWGPVIETARVAGKAFGPQGRVEMFSNYPPLDHNLNPKEIILSTDWKPHWRLLKLVRHAESEVTERLGLKRAEIDSGVVYQCIANLAMNTAPSSKALHEGVWYTGAEARKWRMAGQELNTQLTRSLRNIASRMGFEDLQQVAFKIMDNDSIVAFSKHVESGGKVFRAAMIAQLSNWSGLALDEAQSKRYLQYISQLQPEEGKKFYNKEARKIIRKFIFSIRPTLTLTPDEKKMRDRIKLI